MDSQIQLDQIVYNPLSQVTQIRTGAGSANPDKETYAYDGQTGLLTNQKVIKTNSNQTLLDLSYDYQRGNSNGTVNGKTRQLTYISNNLNHNKDRAFEFDTLGRLRKALGGGAAAGAGATANWTQSYGYDRYGNRTNVSANGITANSQNVPVDGIANQTYDQTSNRITTAGYEYDLAGNLVKGQDAANIWQRYEYDAAGRLSRVLDDATGTVLEWDFYASTRQRIAMSPDATFLDITIYAWGGSSVIAEYKTSAGNNQQTSTWKKSYIYAGSRLLSTFTNNNQGGEVLEFHHPDRLGTKLVTNNIANTSFEQSTLPYGTELSAEETGTIPATHKQKFTSYDRNQATGLDYAVNRSYSPAHEPVKQIV